MQDQRPRAHARVNEVRIAVIVPEGTRVLEPRLPDHRHRLCPRSARIPGRHHEDAFGRRCEKDVETSVVMTDRGRPYARAVAMAHFREEARAFRTVAETERARQVVFRIE